MLGDHSEDSFKNGIAPSGNVLGSCGDRKVRYHALAVRMRFGRQEYFGRQIGAQTDARRCLSVDFASAVDGFTRSSPTIVAKP